jgi:hypothetical protein
METISSQIKIFENELQRSKDIALRRKKSLDSGCSFPSHFTKVMSDSLQHWLGILRFDDGSPTAPLETAAAEATNLIQMLKLYKHLVESDQYLEEEISREGAHISLSKLIKFDGSSLEHETDQDVVLELQDLACEIAALSTSFPARAAPFTLEELRERLPLFFEILPATADSHNNESGEREGEHGFTMIINQVKSRQSEQKDVGFGKKSIQWHDVSMIVLHLTESINRCSS